MADVVNKTPNGQIVIGLFGIDSWRPAGVIVHDPEDAEGRYGSGCDILVEVLLPNIDAELVGNAQVKLREVGDEVIGDSRDRGLCLDGVLVEESRLKAGFELLRVGVELAPAWLGSGPAGLFEGVVLDVLTVDLYRQAGGGCFREQEALLLVGQCVAGVAARVAANPVGCLDVVLVGCQGFSDPLVTVSRLAAWVVEVVQKREASHQVVHVWRVLAAEHRQ